MLRSRPNAHGEAKRAQRGNQHENEQSPEITTPAEPHPIPPVETSVPRGGYVVSLVGAPVA
ncbi:hypothetical protein NEUTE2DRAFT_74589 [Neurospora tetrasperma FGSC 2509]|nr:hypothetical protein NEUTE2DRAFT_74589 [Neurospora tetrasperma FGSC 2509]